MINRIYADIRIQMTLAFVTGVVSLYVFLLYLYYDRGIAPGNGVHIYSAQEEGENNIVAIVREQESDPTANDGRIMPCSHLTYGGNILAGINDIRALDFTSTGQFIQIQTSRPCDEGIVPTDLELTIREYRHGLKCVKNFKEEYKISQNAFWAGNTHLIRHKHHLYLTTNSIVIEVGGTIGVDASAIIKKYKPNTYVLLEPIRPLYNKLMRTFNGTRNVYLYNFGLGKKLAYFHVNMEGHEGEATSQYTGSRSGDCLIKVINATQFMLKPSDNQL